MFSGAGLRTYRLPPQRADAAARLRGAPARLRGGRDGHREPQPAAGQRLQGLPRRRRPDLPARRRADRGRDRRASAARRAPARRRRRGVGRRRRGLPDRDPRRAPAARRRATCGSSTRRCTASAAAVPRGARRAPASRPPHVVAEQAEPDPDFPTVAAPEPGGARHARPRAGRAAARERRHRARQRPRRRPARRGDPGGRGGWRRLHGDEIGALLADFLLEHCDATRGARSSSPPSPPRRCSGGWPGAPAPASPRR